MNKLCFHRDEFVGEPVWAMAS